MEAGNEEASSFLTLIKKFIIFTGRWGDRMRERVATDCKTF
jgi:hypothetical protein